MHEYAAQELLSKASWCSDVTAVSDLGAGSVQLLDAGGPFEAMLHGFRPARSNCSWRRPSNGPSPRAARWWLKPEPGSVKRSSYLVPVFKGKERTIISTGTKTLQDQLYFRDLPVVKKALGSTLKTALLKGRANYLCLYRMEQARSDGRLPARNSSR